MYKAASDAYEQIQNIALSPREMEAMAFTKAVHALSRAKENVRDDTSHASALRFNQMLWTLIQANVVEESCRIPAGLKANMLSLSIFVDRQTIKAFADPKAENLDILISINKNIASGLRSSAESPDRGNHPSRPAVPPNQRRFSPWEGNFRPTQTG